MSKGAAATALPSATTGDDCPAALSRQQLAHRLHRVRVALHVSAMPHNFGRSELAHRNFERHWGPKLRAGRQITSKHLSHLGAEAVNGSLRHHDSEEPEDKLQKTEHNTLDSLLREEDEDEARAPDLAAAAAAPLPEADADPEPPLVEMSIALLLPCA
ncbi:hypothetical protein CDL15_Pgr022038 [Punica granatum]|uniref:Uncharacterized protein n=1 Tax=Punica granatum TaxID=22663 RepID=A0A218VSH8_PUNGR|nr:hypothetical protein CDL15_Pgr022038 [Punica granatum]